MYTWAHDTVMWQWSADTFVWQLSIDHNMSNNKLNVKSMQYVLDFQLASVPFHIR